MFSLLPVNAAYFLISSSRTGCVMQECHKGHDKRTIEEIDEGRSWRTQQVFDEFTLWGHDDLPTDDSVMKALDWLNICEIVRILVIILEIFNCSLN